MSKWSSRKLPHEANHIDVPCEMCGVVLHYTYLRGGEVRAIKGAIRSHINRTHFELRGRNLSLYTDLAVQRYQSVNGGV